jgi:chromosomal replication initiation ATPase DnaA
MTRLTEEALQLSKAQKKHLINVLTASMEDKDIEKRFTQLKTAAEELIGEDILQDTRERDLVFARKMVAYVLRKEGFSLNAIGRRLQKDHSTICTLCKTMQYVIDYPICYTDEYDLWLKFKEMIGYDDSRAS